MPRNRTRRRSDSVNTTANAAGGSSSSAMPPRSKAGCWTCRIRRKRCDEQQDESGSCQACTRLGIECLGWGTRRPDWCRDKDKLSEYKLSLKRKLCSRAGTRPSAKLSVQSTTNPADKLTNLDNHDVTRAPSGESPHTSASSVDENEELETDDYMTTPFTPASNLAESPFFSFSPQAISPTLPPQFTYARKPAAAPLTTIAPKLSQLLSTSNVPTAFKSVLTQLIDLHFYKSHPGALEHDVARRAQAIESELDRLTQRASFDSLFSNAIGFEFDPTSFLSASPLSGQSNGFGGMDMSQYGSPMTMWSPDLMSDGMSSFSGSAPTSPAAPLLAMTSYPPSNFNEFLGFEATPAPQQTHFDSTYMSMQSFSSFDAMSTGQNNGLGALGLSNDYLFGDASAYPTPAINLLPPTRSASMNTELLPAKPAPTPSTSASTQDNADPFQIHHETCRLLMQAVLTNDSAFSSSFDVTSPFTLEASSSINPLEECMQRLTEKFGSLSQRGVSQEYLFAATLAGALSASHRRRVFFESIVKTIEGRHGMLGGSSLLHEVRIQ